MQPFESRTSRRASQSSQDTSSQQAPTQGAMQGASQGSSRKRKQMGIAGVSPVQHRPLSAKRPMGYSLRGQKQATNHRRGRGPRMGRSGAGARIGSRVGSRSGFGGILSTWRGRMIVFFGSILLIIILLVAKTRPYRKHSRKKKLHPSFRAACKSALMHSSKPTSNLQPLPKMPRITLTRRSLNSPLTSPLLRVL